ncbi:hypothetical protein ALC57_01503 [Trachymyrmex cornetzi]|uniref:DUF1907 domain-containing protein n=1 Tax=Trachymyrmex cornetzi TaxID=471704 RepID=A0A151JPR3_9HYME|nr:hypothetical protein ALC57_01503 [Trachymyrmex cornetzi]
MNAMYTAPMGIRNESRLIFKESRNGQTRIEKLTDPNQMMYTYKGNFFISEGGVLKMTNGRVGCNLIWDEYRDRILPFPDFVKAQQCTEICLESDMVAVGTIINHQPLQFNQEQRYGVNLYDRSEFHCFNNYGAGGQFITDTTPDTTEYEGYFNVAENSRGCFTTRVTVKRLQRELARTRDLKRAEHVFPFLFLLVRTNICGVYLCRYPLKWYVSTYQPPLTRSKESLKILEVRPKKYCVPARGYDIHLIKEKPKSRFARVLNKHCHLLTLLYVQNVQIELYTHGYIRPITHSRSSISFCIMYMHYFIVFHVLHEILLWGEGVESVFVLTFLLGDLTQPFISSLWRAAHCPDDLHKIGVSSGNVKLNRARRDTCIWFFDNDIRSRITETTWLMHVSFTHRRDAP